jgi:hypothetical protein
MKLKVIILLIVAVVILVALGVSSLGRTQPRVSLSTVQVVTNGVMPSPLAHTKPNEIWMKITFYVTNTASRAVALQVAAVERKSGSLWNADTQALPVHHFSELGKVGANETTECSYVLPYEPEPSRLRVLVSPDATTAQIAQFAMSRFWANVRGQGHYKQFWFSNLVVPSYQVLTPEF